MYVCICNAVTEDDVRSCLAGGACTTPKEVRAACGMKPGCGTCTKRLHSLVSEYRTANDLADAITGGPASPAMPAQRIDPMPVLEPVSEPITGPVSEPATGSTRTAGRRSLPPTAA